MKLLLAITAVLEAATGLALLISPSKPVSLLLGTAFDSPGELAMGRVAGAALLALGTACGLVYFDVKSVAARGLIAAMLLYNVAVTVVLVHACLGLSLSGIGLWPGVALHVAMAVWCVADLFPLVNMKEDGTNRFTPEKK